MTRSLRLALVLLLAVTALVVIPGEVDATVAGGLGRIVFVSDRDDPTGDIYVREFGGSTVTHLTSNPYREEFPRWSPDGTRIAFNRVVGPNSDVYVIDPDGTNLDNVTTALNGPSVPLDWSPDGTQILISTYHGGNRDLWVINADGSSPQQVTSTPDVEWSATWSPDGSTVAYSQLVGGALHIFFVDIDGTNVRNIANGSDPAWSLDGARIAFTSDASGNQDVWVMDVDGTNATNLTQGSSARDYTPVWSPDGLGIAFASDRDGDLDLWTMNIDGSGPAHLTDHPASEWDMSWESVNRPPVAVDDQVSVTNCGMVILDLLSNDYDPDGEPLMVVDVIGPTAGSVGTDAAGNTIYIHGCLQPPPSETRTDFFDYQVEDPRGGTDWATVTITIYPGFADVPASHLFFDDINWLASNDITRGCNPPDNTLFCPDDFVTRGQMAAFLVRALHYTAGAGADLFVDDNNSVFEDDIDRLGTAGVTRGCNPPLNDRFCPTQNVTRGQMAAFLARAFKLSNLGMADLFVDDNGSVFEADIDKLGATGVSRGCNPPANDRFCPTQNVTRAQMAAFIRRAVEYIT